MNISVYNQVGQSVSTLALNPEIFGVQVKPAVLHEAVVAQRANARVAVAHTKQRGDIAGGGKKPWKQKGTGRARQGSIRAPQWRGGGIVFGPRSNRNFSKKINQKVRRLAVQMALSDKVASAALFVLESIDEKLQKTKLAAALLKTLPLKRGSTLLALPAAFKRVGRLAANIPKVMPIAVGSLNTVDILKHVNLVTTVEGIQELEKIYGKNFKSASKI